MLLKATSSGRRIAARWTALAACGRGPRADLVNFTPSMRIRADGSFSRAERFAVRYADAFVRYRVRFAGRVSGEGATGTLRMRARIYTRSGSRLLTRCDSRTRLERRDAAHDRPRAAAAPPPGAGPPSPDPDAPSRPGPSLRVVAEDDQRQRRLHRRGPDVVARPARDSLSVGANRPRSPST